MNRQPPPFDAIPYVWNALPADTQARLGTVLIEYVLGDFASGEAYAAHDQYCTAEIRADAAERRDAALTTMMAAVMEALPDLFGGKEQDPPWAWRDADEYETEVASLRKEVRAKQDGIYALKCAAVAQRQRDAAA